MEKELIEALRSAIKELVLQEVRLLRTENVYPSLFVAHEMKRTIQASKRGVARLVRLMDAHERNLLVRKFIDETMEEEIDEAIETRRNKCLRCIHIRYHDETGEAHIDLPCGAGGDVGCDISALTVACGCPSIPGTSCVEFIERAGALSIEDYLSEIGFLYEVKERLDEIAEIWDYLTRE